MSRVGQKLSLPEKNNSNVSIHDPKHHYGLSEMRGRRKSQEDAAFACWYTQDHFDGLTPQEIGRRLWTTYQILNSRGANVFKGGTTASTTVYDGKSTLITATLADTIAYLVVYDINAKPYVLRLNSVIHHPDTHEIERIQEAGGIVKFGRINGQLAVSRAIGDYQFDNKVVCADASIDIHNLSDIYKSLSIAPENVSKVQVITACDGFTEPLGICENKKEQEEWLLKCLKIFLAPEQNQEDLLARELAFFAYMNKSHDNISISVQTLEAFHPFLTGIYDGHGGDEVSQYAASNIGTIFDEQCALNQEEYSTQVFSAENNHVTYYRDNKDTEWFRAISSQSQVLQSKSVRFFSPDVDAPASELSCTPYFLKG